MDPGRAVAYLTAYFPFLPRYKLYLSEGDSAVVDLRRKRKSLLPFWANKCRKCHRITNIFYYDFSEYLVLCYDCHLQAMEKRVRRVLGDRRQFFSRGLRRRRFFSRSLQYKRSKIKPARNGFDVPYRDGI